MEKFFNHTMDLNRETGLKLWNKRFGKQIKAFDFAGREIAKGAYNDRNSKYGWNVDHILPQCKGGVTAEHNLEIVNIKTNDEKADKFPGFTANGKNFTIVKVENHYEIKLATNKKNDNSNSNDNGDYSSNESVDDECNFFDYSAGIRLYKDFKGVLNKKLFTGTVQIKLNGVQNTAIIDFIQEIFSTENISFKNDNNFYMNPKGLIITIKDYNTSTKDSIENLLEKCILLNTYLKFYFLPLGVIKDYKIAYAVNFYENKEEMLFGSKNREIDVNSNGSYYGNNAKMKINNLVILNTSAKKDFDKVNDNNFDLYDYDYYYTNLSENLKKEVERK